MKRNEIAHAIKSNRLEEVLRAAAALSQDPNMMLKDQRPEGHTWTVTPLFLSVDQYCATAEEREQNFAIVSYLLSIPGIKVSIDREEDDFTCLAAAVYSGKSAVISKLLTHLRYVEFKGDRNAFLQELNQKTKQLGGATALGWAIVRHEPSIARLLLAVDPDNIDISPTDLEEAERREGQLDYLIYDLKRIQREQASRRAEKQRLLGTYNHSKQRYEQYNLWAERAAQFLAFATGVLSLLGAFIAELSIEPIQVVIAAFISLVTWYFSGMKTNAEDERSQVVYDLITEKGFSTSRQRLIKL